MHPSISAKSPPGLYKTVMETTLNGHTDKVEITTCISQKTMDELNAKSEIEGKNCTTKFLIDTPTLVVGETRCPDIDNNAPSSAPVGDDEKQPSALLSGNFLHCDLLIVRLISEAPFPSRI